MGFSWPLVVVVLVVVGFVFVYVVVAHSFFGDDP